MLDEIVTTFAEGVIADIRARIPNNTGSMSVSLGYRWDGQKLVIFSTHKYFTVLETGRKPGKFVPPEAIQDWVRTKLKIADEKEVRSIGFLINRKLKEEGSLLYRSGGRSGVISEAINQQRITEQLTNKIKDMVVTFAINKFIKHESNIN